MLSLDAGRSREGRVSPTLPLIAARKEILREHYALLTFANLLTIITRGTEQSFLFLSFQFFFLSLSLSFANDSFERMKHDLLTNRAARTSVRFHDSFVGAPRSYDFPLVFHSLSKISSGTNVNSKLRSIERNFRRSYYSISRNSLSLSLSLGYIMYIYIYIYTHINIL